MIKPRIWLCKFLALNCWPCLTKLKPSGTNHGSTPFPVFLKGLKLQKATLASSTVSIHAVLRSCL